MADDNFDFSWWNPGDFNLGFNAPDFSSWFDPSMFNLGGNWDFSLPDLNWALPALPDFNFPNFSPTLDLGRWQAQDPLALPTFSGQFSPAFMQGMDTGAVPAPGMAGSPQTLGDVIPGYQSTAAPNSMTPAASSAPLGQDPLVNMMGTSGGLGSILGPDTTLTGLTTGQYGTPGQTPGGPAYSLTGTGPMNPTLNAGPLAQAQGLMENTGRGGNLLEMLALAKTLGGQGSPGVWDTIAKLGAAVGPTALGAAGLGLQAANQPKRNPLDDQLKQAQINSVAQQDALARDRLEFEKQNAEAMRQFQEEMQAALLESRRPGGAANIQALLQSQPQLAALYNALTNRTTGLANGDSPEFNALIESIAGVDIQNLRRQADEQIAQANEMATRQGINPAGIIAKIQQEFLQQSAAARANARQTLVQQLTPGINVMNTIGGLFGNLFQVPSTA